MKTCSEPKVKEFYRKRAERKNLSARMLKIVSLVPKYITGRNVLDAGSGNLVITTCMDVYSYVTAIDIEDNIYEYEPKDNKKFDVVCCFDVLEHLPDVPLALERLKHFCKDGGLILVNIPEQKDNKQPIDNLVEIKDLLGLGKLIYLERYVCYVNESYNFMVFIR
jgi:SAM-dependent methyltransferase